jgi:hypothetical protein
MQRYLNGGSLTRCGDEEDTTFTTHVTSTEKLFQHCFIQDKMIQVECNLTKEQNLSVRLISISGQEILCFNNKINTGTNRFSRALPEIATGIYVIQLLNTEVNFTTMVFVE